MAWKTFDVYSHLSDLCGRDIDRVAMLADVRGRYLAQIDANIGMPGYFGSIISKENVTSVKPALRATSRLRVD